MGEYVARMGNNTKVCRLFIGKYGRVYLEDLGVDGRLILKYISQKQNTRLWSGLNWLKIRASGELLRTR
jgi:hypothetical protein